MADGRGPRTVSGNEPGARRLSHGQGVKTAGFAMAAVLLVFLCLEVPCRLLRWNLPGFFVGAEDAVNFEQDRFLLFRTAGEASWDQGIFPEEVGVDYTITVHANRLGFRDRIHSPEKPPGTYRILCLGDSSTFGHGVEEDRCFARRLEAALGDVPGKRYEVINAGVSGYSSQQGLELLRREMSRYDPDCLVVAFASNDSFKQLLGDYGVYTDRELIRRISSQKGSTLFRIIRPIKQTCTYRMLRHLLLWWKFRLIRYARRDSPRVPLEENEENLSAFCEIADRDGLEIIFLGLGPEDRIAPYLMGMERVASEHGSAFVDANRLFRKHRDEVKSGPRFRDAVNFYRGLLGDRYTRVICGESLLYATVDCWGHPNIIGHQLIADRLLEILCVRGAVTSAETCRNASPAGPETGPDRLTRGVAP